MRILLIRPCCMGDVVLATAAFTALRRAYPNAHITWAVGRWSQPLIESLPGLDALLDTGTAALPVKALGGFWRFVRQVRAGHYDVLVSLVRSPLMSLAAWFSGVPQRAGPDSNRRGFGYTLRLPLNPDDIRHEAEIYLDVVRTLGIDTHGCYARIPVQAAARLAWQARQAQHGPQRPYIVINPAGGDNPGMVMHSKRWPAANFAALADALAEQHAAQIVLLAGPNDGPIVDAVQRHMRTAATRFVGGLPFAEIGALAESALLYVGNDTGLTHLAAAVGAKTVMIFGPSDPRRYAPFTPDSIAVWRPAPVPVRGVVGQAAIDWDWARDGVDVPTALSEIRAFMARYAD